MNDSLRRFVKWIPLVIILVGVVLRLKYFLNNCSFNIDEARIGVDIYARSFKEILLHQLAYSDLPIPPIGQLLVDKMLINLFGYTEFVLRLYPLLCGIVSIFLFWKLLKIVLEHVGARLVGLILFCCSNHLIFYSASAKQYSSDVMFFLIIILSVFSTMNRFIDRSDLWKLTGIGIVSVFFSYTAVFALPFAGVVLLLTNRSQRDSLWNSVWVCLYWLIGFVFLYGQYFRHMSGSQPILDSAVHWFMPKPVHISSAIQWSMDSVMHLFRIPGGYTPLLAAGLFLAGCLRLWRSSWKQALILLGSIICVYLAACMDKYPFFERYVTYLVPVLIVFILQGLMLGFAHRTKMVSGMSGLLAVLVCVSPLAQTFTLVAEGECRIRHRQAMESFMQKYQTGDLVYLNTGSQFLFWYYGKNLGFNHKLPDHSIGDWNGRKLSGLMVGRIYDNWSGTADQPLAGVRYETYAYDTVDIFQTKFTDDLKSQTVHLFSPEEPFTLKLAPRIWLIQIHQSDKMAEFVLRYFKKSGRMTYAADGLYLFEGQ